jgi:hypothetical protein
MRLSTSASEVRRKIDESRYFNFFAKSMKPTGFRFQFYVFSFMLLFVRVQIALFVSYKLGLHVHIAMTISCFIICLVVSNSACSSLIKQARSPSLTK